MTPSFAIRHSSIVIFYFSEENMSDEFKPIIIAFCCNFWGYTAADLAGTMRLQYPSNIRIIRIPCTGKVDVIHILHAFEKGADGVYVVGCMEGECHFNNGNLRARKRVEQAQTILEYNTGSNAGQAVKEIWQRLSTEIGLS